MLRLIEQAEQQQQKAGVSAKMQQMSLQEMLERLGDPKQLRNDFATILGQEGDGIPGFTSLMPYIIDARNQKAMDVLAEQIALGKKRIGIFYGAAHLPDFERRLLEDDKFVRVETRWITAWDLDRDLPKRAPMTLALDILRSLSK